VLHSRAWYYNHVTADPVDDNTVYVLNVPMMKSIDGGKTWTKMTTPHSDHHDHWVNPNDNRIMINANDGGATVSFDAGQTWSSIVNQPTAQFYRVTTDNQLPYRIYGGQQDDGTVSIASRTYDSGIGREDYFPVGGGESAHIAFDPDDPRLIYATSINGTLTEYDHDTKHKRSIKPYPEMMYGKDSVNLKYRANWNTPVAVSPHDPSIIYYGTQKVLRSTDRGATWSEISPDLTRNDPEKQGRNGGPLTPENVGAEFYNTIFYIVESPHEENLIWVGSDDGLVHLTRDGGKSWNDVSPKHPGEAMINAIEISPHDPGAVYLAVTGYKLNDFRPYIYKTSDYGRRWQRIDDGLPGDSFVRVAREDPVRKGLLYAGTETGIFISFNDGKDWQPLQLNLPDVPITDLAVRQGNLVAATQGRAFWVLDDLFVLRQASDGFSAQPLHVFAPGTTQMVSRGKKPGNFEGANPANGVQLYYHIRGEQQGPLTIEILDGANNIVRSYSSEESDFERCKLSNMDPRSPFKLKYPATETGLNRWAWDMRRQGLHCVEDIALWSGFDGARVAPGDYRARISIGGVEQIAAVTLEMDPRVEATEAEIRSWVERTDEVTGLLNDVLISLDNVRKARRQIEALLAEYPEDNDLQQLGRIAIERIQAWDEEINQVLHQTYEDEDAWETKLAGQLRHLLSVMDSTGAPVTEGALLRLTDLEGEWHQRQVELESISHENIALINEWAKSRGVPHVAVP
jgi:photosystem II stability/assembly factor-like uncharacterized protein